MPPCRAGLILALLAASASSASAVAAAAPAQAGANDTARGNAICRQATSELRQLPPPITARQLTAYLNRSLSLSQREIARLAVLRLPGAASGSLHRALALVRQEEAVVQRYADDLRRHRVGANGFTHVSSVISRTDPKVNGEFRRAGLADCAK